MQSMDRFALLSKSVIFHFIAHSRFDYKYMYRYIDNISFTQMYSIKCVHIFNTRTFSSMLNVTFYRIVKKYLY